MTEFVKQNLPAFEEKLPYDELAEVRERVDAQESFIEVPQMDLNRECPTATQYIIYDIETGPLPEAELRKTFAVDVSKIKDFELIGTEFDESSVKCGNIKDPEKIKAKIYAAREDFEIRKSAAAKAVEVAEEVQFKEYQERAPLSALTGQVLAIGIGFVGEDGNVSQKLVIGQEPECSDEKQLLGIFFDFMSHQIARGMVFVGHNNLKFDNNFLLRRCWANGVQVPIYIISDMTLYKPMYFADTMKIWGDNIKLDTLAQFLGKTRKNGSGSMFWKLFHGTQEDRTQAFGYLFNDITMTYEVASGMGVFHV